MGQPIDVIATSLAESLDRILLPPGITVTLRTEHGEARATRGQHAHVDASHDAETRIDIGPRGARGAILLQGATNPDSLLVARIAANLVDSALRESALTRETAAARSRAVTLEKHLALSQLVMGVAHELRTPLTYANSNLHLALLRLERRHARDAHEEIRAFLQEVLEAHDRIAHTVDTLRRFSNPRKTQRGPLHLSQAVAEALHLFMVTHVGRIQILQDLRSEAFVIGDRVELQQVVLNLLENAADAMETGGATITVATRDQADRVVLTVQDDGPGVPPHARDHLFTPFFTTKDSGTGLGLSIARRIVEAHDGTIQLAPTEAGALFEVSLPSAPELSATEAGAPADSATSA